MVNIPPLSVTAAEVRPNIRISGTFLVRRKNKGVGKTGKAWLQLVLGDKTGTVDARVWENADAINEQIQENDIVDVEGQGVSFMDNVQLKVARLTLNEQQRDPVEFLPEGKIGSEALLRGLQEEAALIAEPWIKKLLEAYLQDAIWCPQFLRASAAKAVHHAYIGGLAEHTLSMMKIARMAGNHYKAEGITPLNVDVLVAGAFLHDTGKVDELSVDDGFAYTDAGRLIGHIQLGLDLLDHRVAELADFPTDLHMHLRHLILSHHGEYEFGSPRRPKTIEAIILHFIDNLDARIAIFHGAIHAPAASGHWTGLEASVGRHIYRKDIDTGS